MFKAMIVDDMEVFRRDVRRMKLWGELSGFVLEAEAVDGQDALKKLEENPVDLIITDIRMPKKDGIELLRTVSEQKLCPVTVLLSDFTEYSYARQGFVHGAFDYLAKPVQEQELSLLLERIKKHLDDKLQQERQLQALLGIAGENSFIADDTKQITLFLQNGDPRTVDLFTNLMDKIVLHYNHDRLKIQLALQNTMHEMIDEVLKKHDWMDLFLDVEALRTADYYACKTHEDMVLLAMEVLNRLLSARNKFLCDSGSQAVIQACEYTLRGIDESISVKILAEKLFLNKSYLSEIFKQHFGTTLLEYITMVKMERAKKLLQEGADPFQITEKLGYKDFEYFGRLFKQHTGIPMKDYKNRI